MAKKTKQTIEETLEALNKLYGVGSLMKGDGHISNIESVPHKTIGFNLASNIGGLPRGKLIQIEGNSHVGKTTFIGEAIASFQAQGDNVALSDYEYAFDKAYGVKLGIDMSSLYFSQMENAELGYEIIIDMIKSGNFTAIFIDSLNMMVSKERVEKGISDKSVAAEARVHDIALKKIKPMLSSYGVSLIGISQYRDNIGAMGAGNEKSLAGGNAWKFGADMRIKLSRLKTVKDDDYFVNNVEIIKNKCGSPFRKEKWYCSLGNGTDHIREVLEYGKEQGIISLSGSTYSHGDTKLGAGYNKVATFFEDNADFLKQIEGELYQKLGLKT